VKTYGEIKAEHVCLTLAVDRGEPSTIRRDHFNSRNRKRRYPFARRRVGPRVGVTVLRPCVDRRWLVQGVRVFVSSHVNGA
jgi:hypothetical protein